MMKNKCVMLLMAAMVVAVLVSGVQATPDVYYYGDTCTVPSEQHFLSFHGGNTAQPVGFLNYRIYTVYPVKNTPHPIINHYTMVDERDNSYKLGKSYAEQEKLAMLREGSESATWCYTLPDPVQEAQFSIE